MSGRSPMRRGGFTGGGYGAAALAYLVNQVLVKGYRAVLFGRPAALTDAPRICAEPLHNWQ